MLEDDREGDRVPHELAVRLEEELGEREKRALPDADKESKLE